LCGNESKEDGPALVLCDPGVQSYDAFLDKQEKLQIHENGELFLAETDLSKDVISLIGEYQVSPDHRPWTICIGLECYTWRNRRKSWKMASLSVTVQRLVIVR